MLDPEILDLSPVYPPYLRSEPAGVKIDFDEVISDAEMLNVVTADVLPDVRIHSGKDDFIVIAPGHIINCVAASNLPEGRKARAREIIRRLAYGFHDFSAREVAKRYHSDLKRKRGELSRV